MRIVQSSPVTRFCLVRSAHLRPQALGMNRNPPSPFCDIPHFPPFCLAQQEFNLQWIVERDYSLEEDGCGVQGGSGQPWGWRTVLEKQPELTFSLSGRWWNPGQKEHEGGSHLQEGFQISKCTGKKPRSCHDPGLETRNSTQTQGMIEATNREIPPFPEKGLWAES